MKPPDAVSSNAPKRASSGQPGPAHPSSFDVRELYEFSDVARRGINGIGEQLRANLVPPIWRELRRYNRTKLRADLFAGATIAVLAIPQSIGFALIAGLPVQAVFVTAIVGAVACACFTSSRHVVFGPTNTMSIIVAGTLIGLHDVPLPPLQKALILGFMIGCIQLAAGVTQLGRLTQFISRTVIIAYTTAVAVLIGTGQIGNLLGIARTDDVSLPGTVKHLLNSVATFHFSLATALVGCASLLAFLVLRRCRPRWPDGLIILGVASLVAALLDLDRFGVKLVRDLGDVAVGLPIFTGFPLNADGLMLVPRVTSVAVAMAVLGMLESVSLAKTFASRSGEQIDPNQELIGSGLGNLAAAVFGAMPGSASFLRTAVHARSGGSTQIATIVSAVVLLGVFMLAGLLNHVPVAALAAFLITVAARLINPVQITIARRATRSDAAVFWVTLMAALFLQLDTAVYVGVACSLILFLQKASTPSLVEYAFNEHGQLAELEDPKHRDNPQVSIVHVEGDLFFGAADLLQDQVRRISRDPQTRVVVLRLKNARHLDATTVFSLLHLHDYLSATGRHLLLSGVGPDVQRVLANSGALAKLGEENIFITEDNPTLSTKYALQRAKQLLAGAPVDVRLFYDRPPQPSAA